MSNLPTELDHEILTWVPAKLLLRFRCVCKEWQRIIDDPDFRQLHVERQVGCENMLLAQRTGYLFSCPFSSVALDHPESSSPKNIEATYIGNRFSSKGVLGGFSRPAPSCHGLTLIRHFDYSNKVWYLWNPFLGGWLELPHSTELESCSSISAGLGYDSATNDYKCVRIVKSNDNILKSLIYSVKLNEWHMIQDFPSSTTQFVGVGAFMDGVLHWIAVVKEVGSNINCIMALDLTTESYVKLPLPSALHKKSCELYASSGFLFINCYDNVDPMRRLESIWILKNCGSDKVWTRLISFKNEAIDMYVVYYIKNKEQVLLGHTKGGYLLLGLGKNVGKEIILSRLQKPLFDSQVFSESLVQLTSIASEVNASKGIPKRRRGVVRCGSKLKAKLVLNTLCCWESV